MSALEEEIIAKFYQLDVDARKRVLTILRTQADRTDKKEFDVTAWLKQAEAVQITLKPDADGHTPSASDLLDEVREERDNDILRSVGFGNAVKDSSD